MRQTIITLTKDGTIKNNGYGIHAAHFMRDEEMKLIPASWDESTFTVERRVIDHDNLLKSKEVKKEFGVPYHTVIARNLHLIVGKKSLTELNK